MEKQYLSKAGMVKLQADLNDWKYTKRPAMVKQLQIAREHGDLSENAEYSAAKEELARIDAKIHQLEALMHSAIMIDSSTIVADQVRLADTCAHSRREKEISARVYDSLGC